MPDGRIHTPLPAYLDLQRRIAAILRRKANRLIFATTTPVHADQFATAAVNGRRNEDIVAYNQAAVDALSAEGVEINDLHGPVAKDVMQYIAADKVHLSPAGVVLCAGLVRAALLGQKG
jgi:lysophospholipase L1-like esterase